MEKGNLFDHIPDELPEERFDPLLASTHCRLERIVSRGHVTPSGQWYDQAHDEWVLLLRGRARLVIDGRDEPVALEAGDYLLLPARCRHRVAWTDPSCDTIWLALHLPPVPAGRS